MNKELTKKLFDEFEFFRPDYSVQTDDGWFDLIYNLCKDIQRIIHNTPDNSLADFKIVEMKEKFACLRIYYNSANKQIVDIIHKAEEESKRICEKCGKRGTLCIKNFYYQTLCKSCAEKYGFKKYRIGKANVSNCYPQRSRE